MSTVQIDQFSDYSDAEQWNIEVIRRAQDLANMGYVPCAIAFGTKAPFNARWNSNTDLKKILQDFSPGNSNNAIAAANGKGTVKFFSPNRLNLGVVLATTIQGFDQQTNGVPAAIDVDVNDAGCREYVDSLFDSGTIVRKFGTKGFTQFVRVKAAGFESTPKNMTLSNGRNKAGIEFLYNSRQTVIPPSVYISDKRLEHDPDAFKNAEILPFNEYIGLETTEVHAYKWLTRRPLWEVPIEELPELTSEHYTELMIYIGNPDSKLFNLHKATYQGTGQAGDFRYAALGTVASYVANKFSDAFIYRRCRQLARAACVRGGMAEEFDTAWNIDREIEGYLTEARAKFASGTWTESQYSTGSLIKNKLEIGEYTANMGKRLMAVRDVGGVAPKSLISNKDFDEKNVAAMIIEDNGGALDWIQMADFNTGKYDPDYMFQYSQGYWHKIPVNPRDSYFKVKIEQKYGLNGRQSPKVLASLNNYTTHVDRRTFEQSRTRYIKVNNGTFDVQTMELVEDQREFCCTSKIDVEYGKLEAFGCPLYEKFLDTIFTQKEVNYYDTRDDKQREDDKRLCILAFEEWMGYTLIQDTDLARALFLFGRAQTGKNVALRLLRLFHSSDKISKVALDQLHLPIWVSALTESSVNICDEVGKKESFSAKDFKKIVGGEGVPVEKKYENPRHDVPITARLAFALNEFPSTVEINNSLERRMLFLSCNNVIADDMKDGKISHKLAAEKNGIFIRWVEGLKRLQTQGDFTLPLCHKIEVDQFRRQNDPLADFLDYEVEQIGHKDGKGFYIEVWTEKLEAYLAFKAYSEKHGVSNVYSEKTFMSQLTRQLNDRNLTLKRRTHDGERQLMVPLKLRNRRPEYAQ